MPTEPTTPPILPQAERPIEQPPDVPVQPATPLVVHPSDRSKKRTFAILAVVVIMVIAVFGSMALTRQQSGGTQTTPTPTPVSTQSAESTRPLSSIATESAFLEFEKASDELVRGIQNAQILNQAILPPTLDLPLGFSL